MKWTVGVYLRIRPPREGRTPLGYRVVEDEREAGPQRIQLYAPSDPFPDHPAERRPLHEFRYNEVFDVSATQGAVYDRAARSVVMSALDGYNATVFAYGQTGSGKTYTLTGGETYGERGVIPRAIAQVFDEFRRREDHEFRCYVSYLEIYNESGFDLLDSKPLEEWTKVHMKDDDAGDMHLINLKVFEAKTEEEALNLLFLGNMNRITSSTPMNEASSRSHCIFTMTIEGRHRESERVRLSKLHLVDLAGSERIYRSAGDDRSRREGRHINLSLHYLEQVIVALQQRARGRRPHIPYRNSTMTSVLRDSLGGNCRTVFVATLNAERDFTEETLSTCRFAQRCSSLLQEVRVNEEVDVSLLLKRMQRENKRLKQQLRAAPRPDPARQLTAEERTVCRSLVDAFVADSRAEATMRVQDMAQAEHCFALLRSHVRRAADAAGGTAQGEVEAAYRQCEALEGAGARLRQLVEGAQQEIRDLRRRAHDAGVALPHSSTLSARVPTIPPRETAVAAQGGRAKAASSPVHASIQLVRSKRFSRRTSHTRGGRGAEEGVTEGQRPGQEVVQESHHRQSAPPPHTDRAGAPTVSGPDQAVPPASEGADTASWSPRGKRGLLASMLQSQLLGGARSGGGEAVVEEEEEAGTPVARLESDDGTAETESHDEQEQQEQQEAVEDEDEGEGKGKGEPTPMGGASTGEEASSAGAMGAAPAGTLPPHLAWARASALPEADLVRALRPRDANALTALLRRGGVFVKHGRRGSPHPRFVWCDEACEEVMWRRVGGRRARGRIRLADVLGVVTGQHTRGFLRRKLPADRAASCLSLVTRGRTLDLEAGSAGETGTTAGPEARDQWVRAFRFAVGHPAVAAGLPPPPGFEGRPRAARGAEAVEEEPVAAAATPPRSAQDATPALGGGGEPGATHHRATPSLTRRLTRGLSRAGRAVSQRRLRKSGAGGVSASPVVGGGDQGGKAGEDASGAETRGEAAVDRAEDRSAAAAPSLSWAASPSAPLPSPATHAPAAARHSAGSVLMGRRWIPSQPDPTPLDVPSDDSGDDAASGEPVRGEVDDSPPAGESSPWDVAREGPKQAVPEGGPFDPVAGEAPVGTTAAGASANIAHSGRGGGDGGGRGAGSPHGTQPSITKGGDLADREDIPSSFPSSPAPQRKPRHSVSPSSGGSSPVRPELRQPSSGAPQPTAGVGPSRQLGRTRGGPQIPAAPAPRAATDAESRGRATARGGVGATSRSLTQRHASPMASVGGKRDGPGAGASTEAAVDAISAATGSASPAPASSPGRHNPGSAIRFAQWAASQVYAASATGRAPVGEASGHARTPGRSDAGRAGDARAPGVGRMQPCAVPIEATDGPSAWDPGEEEGEESFEGPPRGSGASSPLIGPQGPGMVRMRSFETYRREPRARVRSNTGTAVGNRSGWRRVAGASESVHTSPSTDSYDKDYARPVVEGLDLFHQPTGGRLPPEHEEDWLGSDSASSIASDSRHVPLGPVDSQPRGSRGGSNTGRALPGSARDAWERARLLRQKRILQEDEETRELERKIEREAREVERVQAGQTGRWADAGAPTGESSRVPQQGGYARRRGSES